MKNKDQSFSFVSFSFVFHILLIASLAIIPRAQLLAEGTIEGAIEFTAIEPPKGGQTLTKEAAELPDPIPVKETPQKKKTKAAGPTVVLKKKKPKKAPAKKRKAQSKTAKKPPKTLPKKAKIKEQPKPKTPPVAVVPVPEEKKQMQESVKKLEKLNPPAEPDAATEALPLVENKTLNEKQLEPAKDFESDEENANALVNKLNKNNERADQEIESEVAQAEKSELESLNKPVPAQVLKEAQNKFIEEGVEPQQTAQAPATQVFGVPAGRTIYTDLKQVPGNVPPSYPEIARRRRWQGTVVLHYDVTSDGRVSNVRIARSSGYSVFDERAVTAISRYRYTAGQSTRVVHPVQFKLRGPAVQAPSRLRTSRNNSNYRNTVN